MIFIMLNRDVKTIPTSLRTSDGVRRKLFFKGKLYTCRYCCTKQTFTEGCPSEASQHNQQELEQNTTTTENINILKQKPSTEICGRNRTQSLKREHTNTAQQPNIEQQPKTAIQTLQGTKTSRGWILTEQAHPRIRKKLIFLSVHVSFPIQPLPIPSKKHGVNPLL